MVGDFGPGLGCPWVSGTQGETQGPGYPTTANGFYLSLALTKLRAHVHASHVTRLLQ